MWRLKVLEKSREITPFGWEVKRRLTELKLDQKGFCKRHNIPEARLSELITGKRPVRRYRSIVEKELGIGKYDEKQKRKVTV